MTQILVVKPGTLTVADRKALRTIGVVVVQAEDTSSVKLIDPAGPDLHGNDMLYAAMSALCGDGYRTDAREEFFAHAAKLMKSARGDHIREERR